MDVLQGAMDIVLSVFQMIMNFVFGAIEAVFNLLFFWLPDDPFIGPIQEFNRGAVAQGISWLNWFVDLNTISGIAFILISVLMLFACFKFGMTIYQLIRELITLIPFI